MVAPQIGLGAGGSVAAGEAAYGAHMGLPQTDPHALGPSERRVALGTTAARRDGNSGRGSAFLLMITVWTKANPASYMSYQPYDHLTPVLVLNLLAVVLTHIIAVLEHLRAHYPSRYERLVLGGRSHTRPP
ncbi:uncharacterized protein PG998_004016 [Apiospora kogelbergensis]|uniref:Uncharacterized protein n=1 Tax=Apiospora kogelbergensis TaxID=1337665 RepID=A0AAW0QPK1_9PEZI